MTVKQQVEGTMVTRQGKISKIPVLFTPMKLLVALASPGPEKKFLNKMKADLEGSSV